MDAACVRSLLLTSSTSPRQAARPVSRSSSDGVTRTLWLRAVRGFAGDSNDAPANPANHEPRTREPTNLRTSEVRGAAAARAVVAARATGAVAAAGRTARVAARFVSAAADRFASLVDHLASALGQRAGRFGRLLVLLRRGVAPRARLVPERAAQLRARLRRKQHPEAGPQHGAGQQAHHEPAGAAAFVVIPIKAVRHCELPPCEVRGSRFE